MFLQVYALLENSFILNQISVKFVVKGPVDSRSALVQVLACCLSGDKPLHELMMTNTSDGMWHHQATLSWILIYIFFYCDLFFVIAVSCTVKPLIWDAP